MSRLTQRSFDELPGSMPTSKTEKRLDEFIIPKFAYEGMFDVKTFFF
jgi:hypothetical protein